MLTAKMEVLQEQGPACMAPWGGPSIQQALTDTSSCFGVVGQEGPVQPPGAWERPRSLPGCMGTGPWSWTEGLELGLGRVFPLLG